MRFNWQAPRSISTVRTEPFYVAIIMPVIRYCMGGLEIDVNSAVVSSSGTKQARGNADSEADRDTEWMASQTSKA